MEVEWRFSVHELIVYVVIIILNLSKTTFNCDIY